MGILDTHEPMRNGIEYSAYRDKPRGSIVFVFSKKDTNYRVGDVFPVRWSNSNCREEFILTEVHDVTISPMHTRRVFKVLKGKDSNAVCRIL